MLPFKLESPFQPKTDATFSSCGRYRYQLDRRWSESGARLCWVMLNPSTADHRLDDPTVRRCIAFSKSWGFGAVYVVNLFAWRSTDPRLLPPGREAIGDDCDHYIRTSMELSSMVVCAWGTASAAPPEVRDLLRERSCAISDLAKLSGRTLEAISVTKDGVPGHPLYLRGDSQPFTIDLPGTSVI